MAKGWLLGALALGALGCSASSDASRGLGRDDDPSTSENTGGNAGDTGGNGSTGAGSSGSNATTGGATGSSTAGSDGENCEELFVRSEPTIPEMLIVLDKSGSMVWPGCANVDALTWIAAGCAAPRPPFDKPFDRWQPSVAAVKSLTSQLQAKISFGLMIFPGPTSKPAGSGATCAAGTVLVNPGLNTAATIGQRLDANQPDGDSTPTAGSLNAALTYFDKPLNPDLSEPPKYVLLVTDGAPNCTTNGMSDSSTTMPTAAARDSYAAVDALAAKDVKTYVIGYDTKNVAELATVLDEMARRGKTGDMAHRAVEDEASLVAAFETIAGKLTSCTYKLDKPVRDPDYVEVILDGTKYFHDDGWVLANDTSIELRGEACTQLQNGQKDHKLSITVKCERIIPE